MGAALGGAGRGKGLALPCPALPLGEGLEVLVEMQGLCLLPSWDGSLCRGRSAAGGLWAPGRRLLTHSLPALQMWACALGHVEAAQLLFRWNRRALAIPDSLGRLPLAVARSRGHVRLATCLEELQSQDEAPPELAGSGPVAGGGASKPCAGPRRPTEALRIPSPLSASPDTGSDRGGRGLCQDGALRCGPGGGRTERQQCGAGWVEGPLWGRGGGGSCSSLLRHWAATGPSSPASPPSRAEQRKWRLVPLRALGGLRLPHLGLLQRVCLAGVTRLQP